MTWLIAPSVGPHGGVVGASGLVMGWLGYLLGRAYFSRRVRWIVVAVLVVFFFGTLLGSLLPSVGSDISWQGHVAGFVAGVFAAWLLHPRRASAAWPRSQWPRARRGCERTTLILIPVSESRELPIGMFDSGVGGLTVARAVLDQLPHEALHYVGDTAHSPYGPKPIAEVRRYALEVMDELVSTGVKALVIACNSASAACLHDARERYDVPVIEVVLPAVRRAVAVTSNRKVGVIGTTATITSRAYEDAFAAAPEVEVFSAACPRFAEFVERWHHQRPSAARVGRVLPLAAQSGRRRHACARLHALPAAHGLLSVVMGDSVTLVSSAEETAKDVYRVLLNGDLLRADDAPPPRHVFRATGPAEQFARLSRRFLGSDATTAVEHSITALAGRAGAPQ